MAANRPRVNATRMLKHQQIIKIRWMIGLAVFATIIGLLVVAVQRQQVLVEERRVQREHERALKAFEDIKSKSQTYAMVFSPELLVMLASDPDCARNLTYIHFDMTDLNEPGFEQVRKFPNLNKLSFYDCRGVDKLLGYASELQSVNEVYFDYIQTTDELIHRLGALPNLKTVKFNYAETVQIDAFARALPNAKIRIADDHGN